VIVGAVNVLFQDTQHLLEVGFQLLFYGTPIMYRTEQLGDNTLGWLVSHNPLVAMLRLVRDPILNGRLPSWETYGIAGVGLVLAVGTAVLLLVLLERRLIFYL
jgi:ABC-type polysaccharide/polyol phosphate export permease